MHSLWSGVGRILTQVNRDAKEALSIVVQETKDACPIIKEHMPGGDDVMYFLRALGMLLGPMLFVLGILVSVFGWIPYLWGAFLSLFGLLYFLQSFGFRIRFMAVQQDERALVERLGRFNRILGPGLGFFTPRIERIRAVVKTSELFIPLFEGEQGRERENRESMVKIDFKDGSATPKGAGVFIQVDSPDASDEDNGVYKAVYSIDNWRRAIPAFVGPIIRTYLNQFTIEDALANAKGGFNLLDQLPGEKQQDLRTTVQGWGFTIKRIVIEDFELDAAVIRAREEVLTQQREAVAARHEAEKLAWRTGGVLLGLLALSSGKEIGVIQQELDGDKDAQRRFLELAQEFAARQMSIAGKALTHVKVDGAGGLEQGIISLLTAVRAVTVGSKNE